MGGSPSAIITIGLGDWGNPSLIVSAGFGIGDLTAVNLLGKLTIEPQSCGKVTVEPRHHGKLTIEPRTKGTAKAE